ncbi:putative aromatic acid decarboxylase [bacterium BMS3Abin07]|nr:putative aromatic acid decarboxylase [bacterium BMS3Abin07]GBE31239.1 putative aromatic acid decarboxylase [bacterium BMS3Bbin05]HDL20173.1 UbiX family flavin prenyltransferase [Nitrospirota bacterium]HDO22264.1 UbiX family flavin prenyltransferase [Nitrospirota bacterium]HDZ87866.1 UbiX family flavin prenyltransferase [Nitrospirota bacterium]
MKKFILAITGASGSIFGLRVMQELAGSSKVHVVVSSNAIPIINYETGIDLSGHPEETVRKFANSENISFFMDSDLNAPISSGSYKTDGMLVVPCSMKTLSSIASGFAGNLIERAADVSIKEGRKLLLSPREMPFSAIHLENMLKLSRLGVIIAPPVPAFYHKPDSVEDISDFITGKILDSMGIHNGLFKRWGGD